MKRTLSKIGGISGLVVYGLSGIAGIIYLLMLIYSAVTGNNLFNNENPLVSLFSAFAVIIIIFIAIAIAIAACFIIMMFIFSLKVVKNANLDIEEYEKKRKPLIAFVVFSYIFTSLLLFLLLYPDIRDVIPIYISIIAVVFFAVSGTFVVIDLQRNSKSLVQKPEEHNIIHVQNEKPNIEIELQKLKEMKENGTLTEEQYNELRKSMLDKMLE